jgi:hypothetical protein
MEISRWKLFEARWKLFRPRWKAVGNQILTTKTLPAADKENLTETRFGQIV